MRTFSLLIIVSIFAILAACGSQTLSDEAISATAAVLVETLSAENAALATTVPTESPATPQIQRVILYAPAAADPGRVSNAAGALQSAAAAQSWEFTQQETLSPADMDGGTRLVVAIAPDEAGIASLAAGAPDTQFIAVGIDGLNTSSNLTTISLGSVPAAELGFIAGYYGVVVTDSNRVGAITISEGAGVDIRNGFLNGARYFCGLCSPGFPPFHPYPLYEEVPTGADVTTLQNAARLLVERQVQTIFLAPGTAHPELAAQLAGQGITLIGTSLPDTATAGNWGLVISAGDLSATLTNIIPNVLNSGGQGNFTLEPSVWHNPDLVSDGRYIRGLQVIEELSRGIIDPLGD